MTSAVATATISVTTPTAPPFNTTSTSLLVPSTESIIMDHDNDHHKVGTSTPPPQQPTPTTTTTTTTTSTMNGSSATTTPSSSTMSHNTSTTTSTISKTSPPRHNYHNPQTPIASIKRPRNSILMNQSTTTTTPNTKNNNNNNNRTNKNGSRTSNIPPPSTPVHTPGGGGGNVRVSHGMMIPSTPIYHHHNDNNGGDDNDLVMLSPQQQQKNNHSTNIRNNDMSHQPMILSTPMRQNQLQKSQSQQKGGPQNQRAISESDLSPMHGVRPVTHRDIHDIPAPTLSLSLEDDDDDDHHPTNHTTTTTPSSPSSSSPDPNTSSLQPSKSWVGQRVDALFSPVYQFLHSAEQEQKVREQLQDQEQNNNNTTDPSDHDINDNDDDPMDVSCHGTTTPSGASIGIDGSSSRSGNVVGVVVDSSTSSMSHHDFDDHNGKTLGKEEDLEVVTTTTPSTSVYHVAEEFSAVDVRCSSSGGNNNDDDNGLDDNNHHSHNEDNDHDDNEEEDDDHSMSPPEHPTDVDEFNPWQFIKSLPEYSRIQHQTPSVTVPPKSTTTPDKTLVLDLDETLVHCTVETPIPGVGIPVDLTFPVVFHNITYTVHVRLRPYLHEFLKRVSKKYEIIVFTASQKVYANELLNLIDPDGIYIQHRLFRESCLAVDGNFLKDLNVLGRDLSRTVLVDNSPHAFGYQVDNGIPIESWFDDPNDRELLKLEKFLSKSLYDTDDVRPTVRNKFQSYKLIEESTGIYG